MIGRLVLVLGLVFLFVAPAVLADTGAHIRQEQDRALNQTYDKLARDASYQKAFLLPPKPEPPSAFGKWLVKVLEFLAPLLRIVFWIGVAAIVGGFLYFLIRELLKLQLPAKQTQEDETVSAQILQPGAETARALLTDADQLAAQGRFAEAVHLLLFRSIADIEDRLPGSVKRSQTSREIELLARMPMEPRNGFEAIRKLVETSFFGGRDLGESQYEQARKSYEVFAFSPQWGGA